MRQKCYIIIQLAQYHNLILRYIAFTGPPLWPSAQSYWLQMQRSGFDSRRYQIYFHIPYNRNLGFSLKLLLNCTQKVEWTPFQTHCFSENLVVPGIEPGPLDL
jgi:hypothetical protein